MNAMLPANLSETVKSLGEAAQALSEEVRADRAQRDAEAAIERTQRRRDSRRQTGLLVIVGVLVLALFGLSVSNRLLGNQNRSIIAAIDSCTNKDGECAKEGQKRTAEVLGELVRRLTQANVEVTACDRTETTDKAYRACVDKALAVLNAPLPSAPPTTPSTAPAPASTAPSPAPAPSGGD